MEPGPLYQIHVHAGVEFVESDGCILPASFGFPGVELQALNETVGLVDLTGWGVLRLRGNNRLDFVHRLSTNDLLNLRPGQGAPTVFTTPIGRIVDLAFVLVREKDLLLIVSRGASETVAAWLQRHIFFNDDVIVENFTEQWALMGYCGPDAAASVEEFLGTDIRDLRQFSSWKGEIEGVETAVARSVPLGVDYLFLTQTENALGLWSTLRAAVASMGGAPAGEMALETKRVAEGRPRYGRELSEDYIPLETGLKWAVSFNKGCYVGQEVIARMETYQRLAKRLVVLGYSDASLAAGNEVYEDGARVGLVTSVAPLGDGNVMMALAYVKTEMAETGRELRVRSDDTETWVTVLAVSGAN